MQADAILNMRLARLTALERSQLKARLDELEALIAELRGILASEERQLEVMLEELDEVVKRHGDGRRTVVLEREEEEQRTEAVAVEEEIADEDVVVTLSHEGFVKRIPMHLYRRRVSSGKALAGMERYEEDFLERIFVARTQGLDPGLHRGRPLPLPVRVRRAGERTLVARTVGLCAPRGGPGGPDRGDDPGGRSGGGRSLPGLPVAERADEADGARRLLEPASGRRDRGRGEDGRRASCDVALSDGLAEVMLLSGSGRAIRFAETEVPVVGRTAQGVKGMSIKGGDQVVGMVLIRRDANSPHGDAKRRTGKRIPVGEFPLQKRGGMGTLVSLGRWRGSWRPSRCSSRTRSC